MKAVLDNDPVAVQDWINHIAPVIQLAVGEALLRWSAIASDSEAQKCMKHLFQAVLFELFHNEAVLLRSWIAGDTIDLKSCIALIAEKKVHSFLQDRYQKGNAGGMADQESTSREVKQNIVWLTKLKATETLLCFLMEDIKELGQKTFIQLVMEPATLRCAHCRRYQSDDRESHDGISYSWRKRLLDKVMLWRRKYGEPRSLKSKRYG